MRWIFALILIFAIPPAVRGEALPDGGVTAPEVAAALKKAGYPADITSDRRGDPSIRSATGKGVFNVYFYECGSKLRCGSVEFTAPSRRKSITAATIASWNRDKRFGRAFQDKNGTVWISMDLETSRGITTDALQANIARWITVLNAFESFLSA